MRITVYGTPAPQGSKRHVGNGVMIESSKKVKPWRQDVKHAALDALIDQRCVSARPWGPDHPLQVEITFYLPRPRSHYGTGRNAATLKPSAPTRPAVKPDIDKLTRSTLDALGEAGLWTDDSRVAVLLAEKQYADHRAPGAVIDVTTAAPLGGTGAGTDLMASSNVDGAGRVQGVSR